MYFFLNQVFFRQLSTNIIYILSLEEVRWRFNDANDKITGRGRKRVWLNLLDVFILVEITSAAL